MTDSPDPTQRKTPPEKSCPVCGRPATSEHRPFCSRRCTDVDLHRWLSGSYAISAAPDPEDEFGIEGPRGDEP